MRCPDRLPWIVTACAAQPQRSPSTFTTLHSRVSSRSTKAQKHRSTLWRARRSASSRRTGGARWSARARSCSRTPPRSPASPSARALFSVHTVHTFHIADHTEYNECQVFAICVASGSAKTGNTNYRSQIINNLSSTRSTLQSLVRSYECGTNGNHASSYIILRVPPLQSVITDCLLFY